MAKVHIVQCLCPQRHCILAISYEEGVGDLTERSSEPYLKGVVEELVANGKMNPHCALCGSEALTYEDRPTQFDSMAEAMPHLEAIQLGNALARMEFDTRQRHKCN